MRFRCAKALCALSLSCSPTRDFHEVESPSYWWTMQRGECGHTLVVDVDGVLWGEGGCETSPEHLARRRSLEENEHERLKRVFADLPKGGTPPATKACNETTHTLRLRRKPDDDVVWTLCVNGAAEWKADGIPDPYRGVVQLFLDARRER